MKFDVLGRAAEKFLCRTWHKWPTHAGLANLQEWHLHHVHLQSPFILPRNRQLANSGITLETNFNVSSLTDSVNHHYMKS
jgi:hypothetical protein